MALISGSSKVEIISQAFSLIGAPRPVNDLDDSPTTAAASQLYDTMLLDMLTDHPWRFAMIVAELDQLATPPPNRDWQFAYQLPTGYLTMYRVYPANLSGGYWRYIIYRDQIWTNLNGPVFSDFLGNPGEENFPAYFVQLMTMRLASLIAMPVAQNAQLAAFWGEQATKQLAKARNIDSKAMPNPSIQFNELWSAHFGL